MLGNYPEENILHTEHSKIFKSKIKFFKPYPEQKINPQSRQTALSCLTTDELWLFRLRYNTPAQEYTIFHTLGATSKF